MPFSGSDNMVHSRYPFRHLVEEQRAMGHYHQYLCHLSGYSAARADQAAESETK